MAPNLLTTRKFLRNAATKSVEPSVNRASVNKALVYLLTTGLETSAATWEDASLKVPDEFDVDVEMAKLGLQDSRELASRVQDVEEYTELFDLHGIAWENKRFDDQRATAILESDLPKEGADDSTLDFVIRFVPSRAVEMACGIAFDRTSTEECSNEELRAMVDALMVENMALKATATATATTHAPKPKAVSEATTVGTATTSTPAVVAKRPRSKNLDVSESVYNEINDLGVQRVLDAKEKFFASKPDMVDPEAVRQFLQIYAEAARNVKIKVGSFVIDDPSYSMYTGAWTLKMEAWRPSTKVTDDSIMIGTFLGLQGVNLSKVGATIRCLKLKPDAASSSTERREPVYIQYTTSRSDVKWFTFGHTDRTGFNKEVEITEDRKKSKVSNPPQPMIDIVDKLFPLIPTMYRTKKAKV